MLTIEQLQAIKAAALAKADRHEAYAPETNSNPLIRAMADRDRATFVNDLRHIASDCDWAVEGCEASMRSVDDYIQGDMDLWNAAESCPVLRRAAA